jgi:long-chain acyl-CoA synthetase
MYPRRGLKGRISRWAFAVGRDTRNWRMKGQRLPLTWKVRYALADKLVYSKLRQKLGGNIRFMISGSAKLSPQVQEWFYSAGLPLIEGYGLTETSAISTVDSWKNPHFGTVGAPLPGVEISFADDEEILIRGGNVARGYHNLPVENAAAFTDGWFHTGDIGKLDDLGNLIITDRKKDLLKTSNGKYVAPQKVENALMANNPYAAQAIVVGEGKQFVTALIVLDQDALDSWAKHHKFTDKSYAELSQMDEIRHSIDRFVRRANRHLERHEQLKKYVILNRDLSMEEGELTPSLKVRRAEVLKNFAPLVEALYAEDSTIPYLPESSGGKKRRKSKRGEEVAAEAAETEK